MTLLIFGSLNMDLVVRAPRLPGKGETLTGHSFTTTPGGKGANQAVACARLGARTRMVGAVGRDVFGEALRAGLQRFGVDVSTVSTLPTSSGVALITVDDEGENNIVIVPGANGRLGAEALAQLEAALADARGLLLQLEIPLDTVVRAAQAARARGVTVILDPAPAQPLPPELYQAVDILTPNESETALLTSLTITDAQSAERAARQLRERGPRGVIIKMGGRGAFALDEAGGRFHAAPRVNVVDTVAAGDAFNGGLAVALAEGRPFQEAVRWGIAAGVLSVTRPGAQAAMPSRAEVEALLTTL